MKYPYYWNQPSFYNYGFSTYNPYMYSSYDNPKMNAEKKEKYEGNKTSPPKTDKPVLNFMGLKIYQDDLLLIALIFFLYSEDVCDPELFIALILLLIS